MAEYNEQSGYIRQGDKPTSAYNAHQDEFGFKEGNEAPNSSSGYGGDWDNGVGGPKSGYGDLKEGGTFDHGTSEQTQFGLEGKTGGYGREGADPMESNFDKAPHGMESVPAGSGWGAEDTCKLTSIPFLVARLSVSLRIGFHLCFPLGIRYPQSPAFNTCYENQQHVVLILHRIKLRGKMFRAECSQPGEIGEWFETLSSLKKKL